MKQETSKKQILFVDDEASIRMTLPPILEKAGFEVRVADSVPDAIFEINSHNFDILITDLNIGEEGDGFLVASSMRHIQPQCATFILTGYPAFETALQAIQCQVDDYLVKPVEVNSLVETLNKKLLEHQSKVSGGKKWLVQALQENRDKIIESIKRTSSHASGSSAKPQPAEYLSKVLDTITSQIELERNELDNAAKHEAAAYGMLKRQDGLPISSITGDFRLLADLMYDVIQNSLKELEPIGVVLDLRRLNVILNLVMEQALEAFAGKPASKSA
ncbi:MAG TPA: response regulator [Candidatus Dormibacteraeota bacterium]|nr:response regulator [Candidatus Dormibacteraeota bacterium]